MSWGLMCRQPGAAPTWRRTGRDSEKSERRRKRGEGGGLRRVSTSSLQPGLFLMRSTLRKTWTLQIQSSLDGSQRFYCALLPCQQCQCVRVCDCFRKEDSTLHNVPSKLHPTQPNQNPDPKEMSPCLPLTPLRENLGLDSLHLSGGPHGAETQLIRDKQLHLLDTDCKTTGRIWSVTWSSSERSRGSKISRSSFKSRMTRNTDQRASQDQNQDRQRSQLDSDKTRYSYRRGYSYSPANKDKSEYKHSLRRAKAELKVRVHVLQERDECESKHRRDVQVQTLMKLLFSPFYSPTFSLSDSIFGFFLIFLNNRTIYSS